MAPNHARLGVFIDRDDTLIHCSEITSDGDLGDPSLVRLLPRVAEAIAELDEAGFHLVVVSNQGGVARGRYSVDDVERVHAKLNELLGGRIAAFRFCPFHPAGTIEAYTREHPWRKPAPGMILDAADHLGIDLTGSWVVGDKPRDCLAGRAAGCRTILVDPSRDPETRPTAHPEADHLVPDLSEAARIILSQP